MIDFTKWLITSMNIHTHIICHIIYIYYIIIYNLPIYQLTEIGLTNNSLKKQIM